MRNWDQHYADPANLEYAPSALLVEIADQLTPGRALDLACGPGRNALYLASLGWQVTAVDSSSVALGLLRESARGLPVDIRRADLERGEFPIPPMAFDLICDFFYLQRDLFDAIRAGVRPGGLFAGAMHLRETEPSAFRLASGELRALFEDWKILYYSEGREPNRSRPSACIVARRA